MSINHPRRIFRPATPRVPSRWIGFALLAGFVGTGGLALATLPRITAAGASGGTAATTVDAQPAQVAVVDAGTLKLNDRVVRLLGVEPPVHGVTCQTSTGTGFDCGAAATNGLAALVRGTPVACRLNGQDEFGRPYAACKASGTDLNRAVIAAGWARADHGQPTLKRDEDVARVEHRGLWAARDASW